MFHMRTITSQRGKALWVMVVALLATCVAGFMLVRSTVREAVLGEATHFAEIVARQVASARSVYAAEVVAKLERDGFGAHTDFSEMSGYVPIPAQFLKMMGRGNALHNADLYAYQPVSRWNIDPAHGLGDDFLRWAWPQLEAQDQANPTGPIAWKPVSRVEESPEGPVLRYLWADPASQPGCVSCHNGLELTPRVQAQRLAAGVSPGKQWQQHQLMGAISVSIPLAAPIKEVSGRVWRAASWFFAVLGVLVAMLFSFYWRLMHQRELAIQRDHELRRMTEEAKASQTVLEAKERAEAAVAELSSLTEAVDQHAMVTMTDGQGIIQYANQRFLDVLGYERDELIGQPHRVTNGSDVSDEMREAVLKQVMGGQSWRGLFCSRTKSGEDVWTDTSIVPVKDKDGVVTRFISIRMDVSERVRAERERRYSATHDALTGLPNRSLLRDRVAQALLSDKRNHMLAAVLFIDLDKFKDVNDTMGHDAGDSLLKDAAQRLQGCVREEDTVARQGGDEFIVLMPAINTSMDAAVLAEKLIEAVAKPFTVQGQSVHLGASIGIAIYPYDGKDVDTLLKHSDTAMYRVKDMGRNNYMFFTPEMNHDALERYNLESDLRMALANGEFELHYQPVVDANSGQIVSMEALLRWNHSQRGSVSPARFIPLAEASGLIVPIGKWVLQRTCQQIGEWQAQGYEVPTVAINLSAVQFKRGDVYETVHYVLSESGIDPKCISVEITESLLMGQTEAVINVLHRLHKLGVHIALDDFGTGYSSLSYLKSMPIDTLKIDRSFVIDIDHDEDDRSIVQTVIAMAHHLKMRVIAEGVETQDQLDFLRAHHCDACQGYHFSKPLPPAELESWLRKPA